MGNSKFSVGSMDFVIDIKPGEIAITTGKFYEMREKGQFVKFYADPDDTIKLYGITADGKVYVSEKDDFEKTDEEFESWRRRAFKDGDSIHIGTERDIERVKELVSRHKGLVSY